MKFNQPPDAGDNMPAKIFKFDEAKRALDKKELSRGMFGPRMTRSMKSTRLDTYTAPTAAKQRILDKLKRIKDLQPGWDFQSPLPTNPVCLEYAKKFLLRMPNNIILPRLSVGTGEEVAYFWETGKQYLIINFFQSGRVEFYYESERSKGEGEEIFDGYDIPLILTTYIRMLNDHERDRSLDSSRAMG